MRPEDEVLAANRAFYDAFEALDLPSMSAIWSEESPVSCVHPGAAPLIGRAQVLASWRGIFRSAYTVKFTLRAPRVLVAGTTAWVVLVEGLDLHREDVRMRGEVFATNIFLRNEAGWRIVHHHASSAPNLRRAPIDVSDDDDDEPPPGTVLN